MKILITLLLLLFCTLIFQTAFAQATRPPVQWQKALGGTGDDNITHAYTGPDGSSILCGQVNSTSGDVTGNHGFYDGWVVKLDASGLIVWQKAYGGSLADGIFSIKQTADGYIMAGYTTSNDGDASGNHGGADGWVIKTDNWGLIQWKKTIGGSKEDVFDVVETTSDGGYILAGRSYSNDGDLNQNYGIADGWVVKLNSAGTIQWQQTYGGTKYDLVMSIIEAGDHNFIFGGYSESSDGNLSLNYGKMDAWVGKVDATNGNLLWNYNYGGSGDDYLYSICKAIDGSSSIVGAGGTDSPNDYNVSGNHGIEDLWLITFDESNGIYTWGNCFGGSDYDAALSIKTTFDKGYILSGYSYSVDGNVSENVDPLNGQVWVVKLNNARTIDWEKTYGGPSSEAGLDAFEKSDGGYFVAAETWGNGGDVSGTHGARDYWALKLSNCFVPPVSTATISTNGPACGGNVTLSIPGGPANYYYHWYKNFAEIPGAVSRIYTATTAGTYSCIVTNGLCLLSTNSPNSIVSKKPIATISPSGTVNKCATNSVTFTANTGAGLTYQWYKGNIAIAGATANTYTTKKAGKYKVYVYNTNTTCGKFSTVTTVNNTCRESIVTANESDAEILSDVLLGQNIPNPFNTSSVIRYSLPQKFKNAYITVTDIVGRTIKQFTLSSAANGSINISAGTLAQGTYVYSLYVDGKFIDSKRMVIAK